MELHMETCFVLLESSAVSLEFSVMVKVRSRGKGQCFCRLTPRDFLFF